MKSVTQVFDEGFVELSLKYARLYKENGSAFISSYRKYESIRSSCELIVSAYKRNGAYEECKQAGVNFEEYANRHFAGKDAQVLADVLLIIYNIIGQ